MVSDEVAHEPGRVCLVQSLGDAVVDYTTDDSTRTGDTYDSVVDLVDPSAAGPASCRPPRWSTGALRWRRSRVWLLVVATAVTAALGPMQSLGEVVDDSAEMIGSSAEAVCLTLAGATTASLLIGGHGLVPGGLVRPGQVAGWLTGNEIGGAMTNFHHTSTLGAPLSGLLLWSVYWCPSPLSRRGSSLVGTRERRRAPTSARSVLGSNRPLLAGDRLRQCERRRASSGGTWWAEAGRLPGTW